jgi:DnaK suppressor protein
MDIAALKADLIERRDALIEVDHASRESRKPVELDQTQVGRLSRMDAMQLQAMAVETGRRREVELQRIDAALRRMEEDDYGFCTACGEVIPEKRLKLDPAAPLCIDCASGK